MAGASKVQREAKTPAFRHSSAERRDGAVESPPLPDAQSVHLAPGLPRVVLQSFQHLDRAEHGLQSEHHPETALDPASLRAAEDEERRGEAAAGQDRARGVLFAVQAAAVFVR